MNITPLPIGFGATIEGWTCATPVPARLSGPLAGADAGRDRHYSRDGATYHHHWLPGDVVVADNLHVAHKATPIDPRSRRILNRTTVRADGVIWHDPTPAPMAASAPAA